MASPNSAKTRIHHMPKNNMHKFSLRLVYIGVIFHENNYKITCDRETFSDYLGFLGGHDTETVFFICVVSP